MRGLLERIKEFFEKNVEEVHDKKKLNLIKVLFLFSLIAVVLGVFGVFYLVGNSVSSDIQSKNSEKKDENLDALQKSNIKLTKPTTDKEIWTKHLEERSIDLEKKIDENIKDLNGKLELIGKDKSSFRENILTLIGEIKELRTNLDDIKRELDEKSGNKNFAKDPANIEKKSNMKKKPKRLGKYLPATTLIKARLISGVIAKTGVDSPSDPVPIMATITGNASMPGGYEENLDKCRVLISGYADLSVEGIISRPEKIVCWKKGEMEPVETSITGVIYNQGINVIRGKVAMVDTQSIKNAWLSALITNVTSGIKSTINPDEGFKVLGLPVEKKNTETRDVLLKGSLEGTTNTLSMVTEYYIKKAENIQPVIQVGQNQSIEILLTEGAWFGDSGEDIKNRVEKGRIK